MNDIIITLIMNGHNSIKEFIIEEFKQSDEWFIKGFKPDINNTINDIRNYIKYRFT